MAVDFAKVLERIKTDADYLPIMQGPEGFEYEQINQALDAAIAALRAEAGSVGNQLLAECYKAMTSAMAVIDAEAGVGRTNANALNALAACRVAIERRDTDRVWRCQSCFRVFPRGQHKECRPRPSQKD